MTILNKILASLLFSASIINAQNVEFEKSNFPDKKDLFKEAKKNFEEGKDAFDIGKKEYDFILDEYVNAHKFYPVSRNDYRHAGDIYFKQAQLFLTKAQDFNPNNAVLNYMLGVINFNLYPQSEASTKYLEKALSLNPHISTDACYFLGWAFQFQLKWDDAIKYYQLYLTELNLKAKDNAIAILEANKKIEECKVGKHEMANPKRVFIDNLGKSINTRFPEYSAFINADESMMIFTACQDNSTGGQTEGQSGAFFEDTYVSTKIGKEWGASKNLGPIVNTDDHDASAGLSPDGSTMFIYKYRDKDGGDIYVSNLTGTTWSKPERLNKNINSKRHESSVSLSSDSKKLYFVSDKEGGLGDRDIYVSSLDPKGEWGVAENIGPVLNTIYAEEGIFMHPDGKTVYFSSKGHKTMGGFDVFKSVFENGKWSEPENLGYPINGPDDDVFFVISSSGLHGYFASSKQGGFGDKDIYKITFLGAEKEPLLANEDNLLASVTAPVSEFKAEKIISAGPKLTVLKGIVRDDKTKEPLESGIELIDNSINSVIANFKSNSSTGKYLVTLPSGKNYGLAVKRDGYLFHSINFDLKEMGDYQEVEINIDLKKIEVGQSIVLKNIFFDFDKATIRSESANELDRLIKLLTENATLKIELGSHTDSKGSDDYNQKLSLSRSQSVVNYLISKGIAADRLVAKGYGESVAVATNDTEAGRQENRRTEFKILSK